MANIPPGQLRLLVTAWREEAEHTSQQVNGWADKIPASAYSELFGFMTNYALVYSRCADALEAIIEEYDDE